MNADQFEQMIDSRFIVEEVNLELTLVEVSRLPADREQRASLGIREEPFSLLFRGPADQQLEQKIYEMKTKTNETFKLFLVPVGPAPDGLSYESVFN